MFTLIAMLVPALIAALSFAGIMLALAFMAPSASYTPDHEPGTWAQDLDAKLSQDVVLASLEATWTELHFYGVLVHELAWAAGQAAAERAITRTKTSKVTPYADVGKRSVSLEC